MSDNRERFIDPDPAPLYYECGRCVDRDGKPTGKIGGPLSPNNGVCPKCLGRRIVFTKMGHAIASFIKILNKSTNVD